MQHSILIYFLLLVQSEHVLSYKPTILLIVFAGFFEGLIFLINFFVPFIIGANFKLKWSSLFVLGLLFYFLQEIISFVVGSIFNSINAEFFPMPNLTSALSIASTIPPFTFLLFGLLGVFVSNKWKIEFGLNSFYSKKVLLFMALSCLFFITSDILLVYFLVSV